jgi:hypothetical protein
MTTLATSFSHVVFLPPFSQPRSPLDQLAVRHARPVGRCAHESGSVGGSTHQTFTALSGDIAFPWPALRSTCPGDLRGAHPDRPAISGRDHRRNRTVQRRSGRAGRRITHVSRIRRTTRGRSGRNNAVARRIIGRAIAPTFAPAGRIAPGRSAPARHAGGYPALFPAATLAVGSS